MNHHPQIVETFVKKVLAHLDDSDPSKAQQFLQLFNPQQCRIIFNSQPFAQVMQFLQMWQTQMVLTQHTLTAVDYHVIPGTATLICNINCKVRFDESGKDRLGQDSVIPVSTGPHTNASNTTKPRTLWGTHYGVSIQLVIDERIFRNDMNGSISSFNYTIVFKPSDSLINI